MNKELAAINSALRGSGCFVFKKGEYFFLYRELLPRNAMVCKSKDIADFKRKVTKATNVVLP